MDPPRGQNASGASSHGSAIEPDELRLRNCHPMSRPSPCVGCATADEERDTIATTREKISQLTAGCWLWHTANQAVALRVKSQPGAFEALTKLLEAPDFQSKLLHARQNPKGAVAQEILSVVVAVRQCSRSQGTMGASRKERGSPRAHRGSKSARCRGHLLHVYPPVRWDR